MQFISGLPIQQDIHQIVLDLQAEVHGTGLLHDVKDLEQNIMVTCPIHKDGQESKPSCGITAYEITEYSGRKIEAGTVNCFTCGYVANLPEFISNVLGYSDKGRFGFKWLSRKYQFINIEERKPIKIVPDSKPQAQAQTYVSQEVLQSYRYFHPYMYRRGLTDAFIEYFDIGYCTETDSITFPINDKQGRTLFVQKRSVQGKRFENDANASKATLFGLDKIMQNIDQVKQVNEVVIVESPIDTITLWQWGVYALGTMQAIPTAQQIDIINSLPVSTLIAAQDSDRAGDVGATRLRDKTNKLIKRLKFPEDAKDVNDLTYQQYASSKKEVAFKSVRKLND